MQVNAAPAGDQGLSASYTSGFSFSIGGGVEISGDGPSGGIQAGATWENSTSITVPPLVVEAGDLPNEGAFTRYRYCTVGNTPGCASNIQLIDVGAPCQQDVAGQPQQGQTPNGRLSGTAQTVNWQVDPATYGGAATFDVTVTWQVNLAVSETFLWPGQFIDPNLREQGQPTGGCNLAGCSCSISFYEYALVVHALLSRCRFRRAASAPSG